MVKVTRILRDYVCCFRVFLDTKYAVKGLKKADGLKIGYGVIFDALSDRISEKNSIEIYLDNIT